MRAAHARRVGLSSMLLLVLLLVAFSRHAAGFSVTKDSDEEASVVSSLTMDDGVKGDKTTTTTTTKKPPTTTTTTKKPTTTTTTTKKPKTTTKKPPTTKKTTTTTLSIGTSDTITESTSESNTSESESSTSASESSTSASESSTSASESSTSTSESSTSTDDGSTSTDDGSTSTDDGSLTSKNPISTLPPASDLKLFEDTRDELNGIEATLDKFLGLIEKGDQPAERTPAGGGRPDLPAAWWKLGKEAETSENIDNICKKGSSDPSAELCNELQDHLKKTESLVSTLNNNVDAWDKEDLSDLKTENAELSNIYTKAEGDPKFKDSVDAKAFTSAIGDVKQEVDSSIDKVNERIDDLTDNPGSVVLVAVIGTVGGLMVVGLIGVMAYGVVKKGKVKKTTSPTPYNKLQGENIPIDGFLSNGPESSPTPKMDPYVRSAAPSNRSDNYASPYGPRSEQNYRGPTVTRVGQGLPRTHL